MATHSARCQCRALTVQARADPDFVVLCNCRACQSRTGSPFGVGAYFRKADLTISGETRTWSRVAPSGRALANHFCPGCGSTVYWTLEMRPDHVGVAAGAFDGPLPEPARAIWAEERHDWVTFPEHWPVFERAAP